MIYDHEKFCTALGQELRRIREGAGLSRQQLADRTGISRTSIERYEAGDDVPVMTYIRLCVALGESCGEVLDRIYLAAGSNATNGLEMQAKEAQTRRRQ